MYDDRKRLKREMRQFELADYFVGFFVAFMLSTAGVTAADKLFHIFDGLETAILHLDFSGPIEFGVRALAALAGFFIGMMISKIRREHKENE